MLALVPNPFALVRLRLPSRTNFSCKLTHQLLITTFDHDVGLIRTADVQSVRDGLLDFVCKADSQALGFSLQRANVADTYHFESLLVAGFHSVNHVLDE